MYLANNSAEEILERMKEDATVATDEGTFIHDSLTPMSEELFYSYTLLNDAYNRVFAENALENGFSLELEDRCAEFGVIRKQGTKATGIVKFYGTNGTLVEKGVVIQTATNLKFKTLTSEYIVNGEAEIKCEAMEEGSSYKVTSNSIKELEVQVPGVVGIINEKEFTGGTDVESDIELFERYKLKLTTPATSGNIGHYKSWALEVPGVSDAVIVPTWNGGGTVKVIAIDSNKRTPPQDILDNIFENIERQRPIGAIVTVVGATEILININARVQLASGATLEEVKKDIEKGVDEYLKDIAFKDSLLRYTKIASILLDIPKIIDYFDLEVNSAMANIEIPKGHLAILGEVVINAA